jgi:transposase
VLQHHFNWQVLSAAAGINWWNFYFRLYPGAIHATEVIDFLGHLLRHLPGKLLVVWDGLPQHRARLVTEFISAQRGRLAIERLPAYAPELNPVEYIWGYWKHHELPNFCPRDFGQLSYQAAAGQDHIERMAHPDKPRKAYRVPIQQRHSEAPAKDPKHGVLRRDAKIAP